MKRLFFILIILIFITILVTLSLFLSIKQKKTTIPGPIPAISPTQNPQQAPYPKITDTPAASLTPTPTNITNPPVQYSPSGEQKLIDKVKNRTPLSESDSAAKQKILSTTQGKSGIVYTSPDFTIEYVKSPDIFQVEIKNENIALIKEEAVSWFKTRGLSQEGICNLPVMFYLNWDTANKLRGTNTEFNPLPDGC